MKTFYNDPMTIYSAQSRDEYGRETWGTGTAINGRFVEKNKLIYSPKGEATMSDALIHLPSTATLDVGYRIKFSGSDYRVMKVTKPKDMSKVRFIKAYLERLSDA